MNIEKLLENRRILIDRKLDDILPKGNVAPKRLHKAMRYSVFSGGKRIRPILAIESCLCCGGEIADVINAACAIELVHTFSLIHDDLPAMDDDNYRRGKLTCHRKFDEATAILAGDALLALAFEVLAEGDNKNKAALIKELSASIGSLGVAGGQCVDIEYKGRKKNAQILNYVNSHKTGALIKAAVKMGAYASGTGPKKIKKIEKFGVHVGEAFQIADDVLDNGDSVKVFGKAPALARIKRLTGMARANLAGFADSACYLAGIADYLVKRKI